MSRPLTRFEPFILIASAVASDQLLLSQIITDTWNLCDETLSAPPAELAPPSSSAGRRGQGPGQGVMSPSDVGSSDPHDLLLLAGISMDRIDGGGKANLMNNRQPFLQVADWWMEHLDHKNKQVRSSCLTLEYCFD